MILLCCFLTRMLFEPFQDCGDLGNQLTGAIGNAVGSHGFPAVMGIFVPGRSWAAARYTPQYPGHQYWI